MKGVGGGFEGKCGSAFGEPEMKAFIGPYHHHADLLHAALAALVRDAHVTLTHYAAIPRDGLRRAARGLTAWHRRRLL